MDRFVVNKKKGVLYAYDTKSKEGLIKGMEITPSELVEYLKYISMGVEREDLPFLTTGKCDGIEEIINGWERGVYKHIVSPRDKYKASYFITEIVIEGNLGVLDLSNSGDICISMCDNTSIGKIIPSSNKRLSATYAMPNCEGTINMTLDELNQWNYLCIIEAIMVNLFVEKGSVFHAKPTRTYVVENIKVHADKFDFNEYSVLLKDVFILDLSEVKKVSNMRPYIFKEVKKDKRGIVGTKGVTLYLNSKTYYDFIKYVRDNGHQYLKDCSDFTLQYTIQNVDANTTAEPDYTDTLISVGDTEYIVKQTSEYIKVFRV